jgi:hypothetical protein
VNLCCDAPGWGDVAVGAGRRRHQSGADARGKGLPETGVLLNSAASTVSSDIGSCLDAFFAEFTTTSI